MQVSVSIVDTLDREHLCHEDPKELIACALGAAIEKGAGKIREEISGIWIYIPHISHTVS